MGTTFSPFWDRIQRSAAPQNLEFRHKKTGVSAGFLVLYHSAILLNARRS